MGEIADYHVDMMTSGKWPVATFKSMKRGNVQMTIDNQSTKVITGKVRLSYANVWEPQSVDGGDPKYSVSILIPKDDKETLRKIKAATDLLKEQAKAKYNGKLPAKFHTPLRDGDEERPDDEAYAGHYFFNASSKNKPGIAKPIGKGSDGKTKFQEITDTTEVYSGCYAKVSVNFYLFDTKGNKGIAAGLNNIVKVQDGDFLGGRSSVNDDFGDEDFDIDDVDDDEDFLG
ncbi:phage-associated protein [Paenibacillus dendritiformis C454]|uniref:Phage-associated protein n=2 Tax=Paenibacillus dendritiformis TaxID=130049 RepID=H3SAC9_9BACL|nr:phage-associated protein [Paenibacillus dendritiformis C454]